MKNSPILDFYIIIDDKINILKLAYNLIINSSKTRFFKIIYCFCIFCIGTGEGRFISSAKYTTLGVVFLKIIL